jgi:hypothetical protein
MLKPKPAKIVATENGFVTTPLQEPFFDFQGSKITIKVEDGKTLKIFRDGRFINLLTGKPGESLNIVGEVRLGDKFVVGPNIFFESFNQESFNTLLPSENPEYKDMAGAFMVSFYEEERPSPLSFLKTVKKLIPERGIVVRGGVGFEETSKGKKTTFSVGIILLVILVVSIVFGVKQKAGKEKEREVAKVQEEARNREAMGIYEVSPELFLDLTLLSSGFKGDTLSSSGGNLYVLDKNSKKIVSIEISSKKSEVVAGQGELSEALDLASYEDRVFISDSEGIKEVGDEVESVIEKDWEGNVLIQAFAGNLYVLDKSAGQIYRFSGGEGGFGSKQNWLAASTKPDFSDASSWTFDGSIYVLTGSKVLKFSQGSPQVFSLASEVLSVNAIYADEENQHLYVLDKENGKVIVLEKDGKFKAQYSSDQISQSTNLVAPESEKRIILLTGEKLLTIEMRHL